MPSARVKVFVIWEPIIFSDLTLPPSSSLARIPDQRARQYYDQDHLVSKALQHQMLATGVTGQDYFVKDKYAWDTMAVYNPGALWDDAGAKPAFVGAPVNSATGYLAEILPEFLRANPPIIPSSQP